MTIGPPMLGFEPPSFKHGHLNLDGHALSQKTDALTNCAKTHKRSGWISGGEPQSILC